MTQALYFDEVRIGMRGRSEPVSVTSEMIMAYADLSGDHTPIHTDEAFARASAFGQRVAHGLLGLSLTDGLKTTASLRFVPGMSLGWSWDFRLPIYVADAVHVRFQVVECRETRKPGWGIVHLASELINQKGEIVQDGVHKLMLPKRPETGENT